MSETAQIGPRLSDERFFTEIVDTTRPGLEEIPDAVARGDLATARRLFAAEVRRTLQPERFFRIRRDFRGHSYMYPGETIAQAAERILRLELISCSTPHRFEDQVDWTANPTYNQYREWTWQLSRHHEWAILAQRYRETGDERYAECFVRLFRSWVRQAIVPEDAPSGATWCWRTIEAGIRMGGPWQWALHSFYRSPHFTDDVLVDWYKSVWEHGWRLRHFHREGGNWLIMEMNGLAQIGILYPQLRDAPAWKAYAFDRLVRELDRQVYPDGFQIELSTGYHQVVIRNYQWLWDVCEAYDEPVPAAFRAGLERMHAVNVRMMMPDGRLPDVNDGGWLEVAPLMERATALYPQRADFRWAHTQGQEGAPPVETSVAFPYAGYYVMRTGWEPDAIWALFDGGPFGYGHQHEDKLNLLLHAYGRLLLTEGGNYAYDDSEMRRYVLSTRAHNTIRVDGQDQNRRLHFRREDVDIAQPAGALWHSTDRYDVVEAAYDEGYGPEADRTVTHRRKVIFLKQRSDELGPCVLVIDRLEPADGEPHRYQALWHLNTEAAEVRGLSVRSADPDQANLAIIPTPLPGLSVQVVSGQEEPEWQGWKAIKNHQQGEYAPTPTAVYEWEATGPVRLVTLLYPTRPGEACPVTGLDAPIEINATVIRLTLADGRVIELDEDAFPAR
ncbi:MAG TPA: hypothetical protein G4O02_10450 [Caldilineae bacterium]|nr:hypothetical protein [Caldilineae bacterium]